MEKNNLSQTSELINRKEINLHFKQKYLESKTNFLKLKESSSNKELIREKRKELSEFKIINKHEKHDELYKITSNLFVKLFLSITLRLSLKVNSIGNYFINFKYNYLINRKTIFTSSMAGESLKKRIILKVLQALFLFVIAVIIIFPFYWMILTSFRTTNDLDPTRPMSFWPETWSLEGYKALFEYINSNDLKYFVSVPRFFLNSIIISVISTALQLVVSVIAGFGLANYRTKAKGVILIILLSTLMIPGEALLLGQYIFMVKLKLKDNILALILPFLSNVFTIYLMSQAFERIGKSVKSASKVDGLSTFKYFWKIALPSIKSVLITSLIISLISSWNAVLWPTMILKTDSGWATVPMMLWGIMSATGGVGGDVGLEELARDPQNLKLAGATLSILPMLIMFLFTNRLIINGITRGRGEKG
ncbi:carbohydrate ABC transporter permease [Spiroplasma taiwanense]|uniref:sn-glycerol-3-phosphate ABC transporter permease n=1 Tax=Spiroplasma taiwanense CT-1 TaxID=1276220 RepID=S5MHK0_9MOLU|nr:carbohydrate ABC transporter permease [Spiroplasma taiwanense]AGR41330.1 sn-glycerol-3-phosphate ABC transporter permease [Spiroplasma taiwanense CT-1]